MNTNQHPTVEAIADLGEGLLPAAESAAVLAHVESCEKCSATRVDLDGVTRLLGAEAAQLPPLPPAVAATMHESLKQAAAERSTRGGRHVSSLREHRDAVGTGARKRRPRSGWVLAAAAVAAVVVAGGIAGGIGGVLSGDDPGGASSDAGAPADAGSLRSAPREADEGADPSGEPGNAAAGTDPGPNAVRINPDRLGAAALAVATGAQQARPLRGACASVRISQDRDVRVTQYGAGSEVGVLIVDQAARSYRLVDCATGSVLYRGTF